MVRPDRERISGSLEVDQNYVGGYRPGKRGRGADGKVLIAGAVEIRGGGIRARSARRRPHGESGRPRGVRASQCGARGPSCIPTDSRRTTTSRASAMTIEPRCPAATATRAASSRESTASSPTSRLGSRAPTTGSAPTTSAPTCTSLSSDSTADACPWQRFRLFWASRRFRIPNLRDTSGWGPRSQPDRHVLVFADWCRRKGVRRRDLRLRSRVTSRPTRAA